MVYQRLRAAPGSWSSEGAVGLASGKGRSPGGRKLKSPAIMMVEVSGLSFEWLMS